MFTGQGKVSNNPDIGREVDDVVEQQLNKFIQIRGHDENLTISREEQEKCFEVI